MNEPYLVLRLEAHLMSFGGIAVDNRGVEMPFPPPSLVAGLLGNALGYDRSEAAKLQSLQNRLRYALRIDREGAPISDFQTADISGQDRAWTTSGVPETRAGGSDTYKGKHLRYRDLHADRAVTLVLTLAPADEPPTLEHLAQALNTPARPLFIGRKHCLPSSPLCLGIIHADSAWQALHATPLAEAARQQANLRIFLPADINPAGAPPEFRLHRVSGLRQGSSHIHGGTQSWHEYVAPLSEVQ